LVRRIRTLAIAPFFGLLLIALVLPALEVQHPEGWLDWLRLYAREQKIFFLNYWKEALALLVAFVLCFGDRRRGWSREWHPRQAGYPLLLSFGLGVVLVMQAGQQDSTALAGGRNFYGTL